MGNLNKSVDFFDKGKGVFELDKDSLLSNKVVLYPGRFYVLQYVTKITDRPINTRPVILSLGTSIKDPDSFLCIDLCVIPRDIRIKFIDIYYNIFKKEIGDNVKKYWMIKDADKQGEIKSLTYQNLLKVKDFQPIVKLALKRYKIKNTKKIYSILYGDIYKVLGNFADENWFINGKISDVQKDFLKQLQKLR
jgi:hypothetical protein